MEVLTDIENFNEAEYWHKPKPFEALDRYVLLSNGEFIELTRYFRLRLGRDSEGNAYLERPIAHYDKKAKDGYISYEPCMVIFTGNRRYVGQRLSKLWHLGYTLDRADPKQFQAWDWPKGYIIEKQKEKMAERKEEKMIKRSQRYYKKKGDEIS